MIILKKQITFFIKKTEKSVYPIGKSFAWFLLTLLFGLFQVLTIIAIHIFLPDKNLFQQVIIEGSLLSFSLAIVSSLTIDYHIFSKGLFHLNWARGLMFIVLPFGIFLSSFFLFILCYLEPEEIAKNIDTMRNAQITIFVVTFFYAIMIKSLAFNRLRNNICENRR